MPDPYRSVPHSPDGGGAPSVEMRFSGRYAPSLVALVVVVGAAYAAIGFAFHVPGLVWLALIPAWWLTVVGIDRYVLAPRAARGFDERARRGGAALARGDVDTAERVFLEALVGARGRPGLEGLALFNLAAVATRRGQPRQALEILDPIRRHPILPKLRIRKQVPLVQALHRAQIGDLERARRDLEHARSLPGEMHAANVEAKILLREGRAEEAAACLARGMPDLERILGGGSMRAVWAQRAFALHLAGADEREVQRAVEKARAEDPRELSHLAVEWDELGDFLVEHELIDQAPSPDHEARAADRR